LGPFVTGLTRSHLAGRSTGTFGGVWAFALQEHLPPRYHTIPPACYSFPPPACRRDSPQMPTCHLCLPACLPGFLCLEPTACLPGIIVMLDLLVCSYTGSLTWTAWAGISPASWAAFLVGPLGYWYTGSSGCLLACWVYRTHFLLLEGFGTGTGFGSYSLGGGGSHYHLPLFLLQSTVLMRRLLCHLLPATYLSLLVCGLSGQHWGRTGSSISGWDRSCCHLSACLLSTPPQAPAALGGLRFMDCRRTPMDPGFGFLISFGGSSLAALTAPIRHGHTGWSLCTTTTCLPTTWHGHTFPALYHHYHHHLFWVTFSTAYLFLLPACLCLYTCLAQVSELGKTLPGTCSATPPFSHILRFSPLHSTWVH